jgi:UDPglucose--hexose-1-phosphate uridylyltransferase
VNAKETVSAVAMSEIRQNRLTGEWVIISPERAKRGGNVGRPLAISDVPPYLASCPFCVGNEVLSGADCYRGVTEDGHWAVRSVVNKFSALSPEGEVALKDGFGGLGETVNGVGLHEVMVESPRHDLTLGLYPAAHVRRILEAYIDRFRAFYADPRIRHVIIYKNHGAEAGASQQHPHSQIVGLPIVPGQVIERLECSSRFHAETGECLACSLIALEREQATRIIAENAEFVAFIPYAALSPYHVWVFPKVHGACFSDLTPEALAALAEILRTVLAKVYGFLSNPPFNLVVRSLGPHERGVEHFHWYIPIVPRVNKSAGFELGTGMYINPSLPEVSARELREFVPGMV